MSEMRYDANKPSEFYDPADFAALKNSNIPATIAASPAMRFDSEDAAAVFFARELDYIKSKTYDKQYPEFTALQMFPVTHEVPEGAESFTYYGYEKTGFAKIISNYATDLPRVDIKGEMKTGYVKGIGDSYGYNVQEMRASRMAGKSLDTRRGEAARYHIDRLTNTLAWRGDSANKLIGVLSTDNGVPVLTLEGGATSKGDSWLTKDPDEIIDDVKTALTQMDNTTQHVEIPDTLGIPSDVYIGLSLKRIPDTNISVLKYLQENLPNIQIKSCPELNSTSTETNPYAKASAGQGVGILYKYDSDKLSIEIPMPFLQHPVQYENLEVKVPCESRVAGAVIYYPMSALIMVGL